MKRNFPLNSRELDRLEAAFEARATEARARGDWKQEDAWKGATELLHRARMEAFSKRTDAQIARLRKQLATDH